MADWIAKNDSLAIGYIKSAINRGIQCDLESALDYESEVFAQCFAGQNQKTLMKAFVDKRKKKLKLSRQDRESIIIKDRYWGNMMGFKHRIFFYKTIWYPVRFLYLFLKYTKL